MKLNLSHLLFFSLVCGIFGILPSNLTSFSILCASTLTNSGPTVINGDIGIFPGTNFTGFPPGVINGAVQINNFVAQNAQNKALTFYTQLSNLPCGTSLTGQDLGGMTLYPGVYCFTSSAGLTGTLTFDGQNQTSPVWVFQIASTLVTSVGSSMVFNGNGAPCNIFWNVGSSATITTSSTFLGIINAYSSVSISTNALITGKIFAQNGGVTLLSNTFTNCTELTTVLYCSGIPSYNPQVCSSNGSCLFNNTCGCNAGYVGSNCQNFTCFSKNVTDPSVCGGNGNCTSANTCTCNPQFNGTDCKIPICYSLNSNNPNVCSGQGTCSSPNNCTCNSQSNGTQCQTPLCFSKNPSDPSVCSGRGTCSSGNNCTCNSQYSGNQCQFPICFSRNSSDPLVCNGGVCSSPNNCTCSPQYNGTQCLSPICFSRDSNDPSVCNGRGTCSSPNTCSCSSQYGGNQCQFPICYTRNSNDPLVCNGGSCNSPNNCTCTNQYNGVQCQYPICFSKDSSNPTVCNGRGTCTAPNTCQCVSPYNGNECQLSCANDLSSFAILAGSTITSTGPTNVNGDVALFPGVSITGFPPGIITNNQYIANTVAQIAQTSLTQRYLQISQLPCGTILTGKDLGGMTLKPGVYCFDKAAQITGTLTLDAVYDSNSIWVFKVGTALGSAINSKIALINLAAACNIFWNVGSSASLGGSSQFYGNILAYASISLDSSALITGKLLAQNGAVTMISNTITSCPSSCTTSCYGKLSSDPLVCGGKGTCSYPGYCLCSSGRNGTQCTSSSTTKTISILILLLSFIFLL